MIRLCSISLLCFLSLCSLAQVRQTENKQAQRLFEEAGQQIAYKDYAKAIDKLKTVVSLDPRFALAWQQLGDSYRKLSNYADAKPAYQKVLEINPELTPLTWFGLAESELYTGDYQAAIEHFKKYLGFPNVSPASRGLINKYIKDCEFALMAIKSPVPFTPVNLGQGVNTAEEEYLPVVTADETVLIFTRQRTKNEDFYQSIKKDGKWEAAVPLSENINTLQFNEGAQCISPDGMYLFFTGCNRPDGMGMCDIYVARREGKGWSKPFNIGAPVNTAGWESQPSLSADGRTLYFVSTRKGGYGSYDIWKSDLGEGGSWSAPVNMGATINTAYDEYSPFIHPDDQTFYFSSNGWPGMGDRDLFISRKDSSGKWKVPQNLGYPINTYGEESGLTISSNGKTAFFASNKGNGAGKMDIYSFELPPSIRPAPITYVKGRVIDSETKQVLQAKVQIVNVDTEKAVYDDVTDYESGEFLATLALDKKFALTVSKEGYLFYSENFSPGQAAATKPYLVDISMQKIAPGRLVVLKNIFFDTGKYELLPQSVTELKQLISFLSLNPSVKIEIAGHTDNVGDNASNQLLSENRAKAVYSYLLNNKIPQSRMVFKGYGESSPAADNETEAGRQNNRRTEFKILSYQ